MSPEIKIPSHITARTSLTPAINAWRIYLNDQGKSPHTVKAFTADMLLLANYLPPDRPLGAITTNELNNFLDWMQRQRGVPCSPKTLARRITSIKAFFRWLLQYGVILVDPGEKVLQQSVVSPLPQVLTPQETEAVMQVATKHRQAVQPDARYFTLLALLLETGIKKGECLALSPNHIDLQAPGGPYLVNGSRLMRNIKINITRSNKSFPGRNAAWSTCSKTWVRKPPFPSTSLSRCAAGHAL
jgi:site-specific recombinase XerD